MISFVSADNEENTETEGKFKMQSVRLEMGSRRSDAWLKVVWVTLHEILTGSLFGAPSASESVYFSAQLAWHVRAKETELSRLEAKNRDKMLVCNQISAGMCCMYSCVLFHKKENTSSYVQDAWRRKASPC